MIMSKTLTAQAVKKTVKTEASRIGAMMGNPTGATYSIPVAFDHVVMIDRPIDDPCNWREEISLLRSAGPADRVLMQINTGGGLVSTAMAIVNGMKQCLAPITTELVGDCCSAGTFIFLAGDEQIVNDSIGHFMIHQASHGYGGVDNHVYDYALHSREKNTELVRTTYRGFLTESEIEQAISGTEFWFTADQVSERCQNRFSMLDEEAQEGQPPKPSREEYSKLSKEELLDAYFGPVVKTEEEIAKEINDVLIVETFKALKKFTVKQIRDGYDVPGDFKKKGDMIYFVMDELFGKNNWQDIATQEVKV